MGSQVWGNCFVSGQNWQPFFPQCILVAPISPSIPLPAFCPLFRDWQELSGGDSALTFFLLFPCAIFLLEVSGESTQPQSGLKGILNHEQTGVCSRRKSGKQSIDFNSVCQWGHILIGCWNNTSYWKAKVWLMGLVQRTGMSVTVWGTASRNSRSWTQWSMWFPSSSGCSDSMTVIQFCSCILVSGESRQMCTCTNEVCTAGLKEMGTLHWTNPQLLWEKHMGKAKHAAYSMPPQLRKSLSKDDVCS